MSQTPLLSIVAAVYNGEKFLAQFFECIPFCIPFFSPDLSPVRKPSS